MSDLKSCHRCGRSNESVKFVYNLCLYCDKLLKAEMEIVKLKAELEQAKDKIVRLNREITASCDAQKFIELEAENARLKEGITLCMNELDKSDAWWDNTIADKLRDLLNGEKYNEQY